ncbi:M12 family metallopeptidase [Sphingobacterium lactis]|uniref:M12 family metallopeptidase n=1 Tax=Sphingobacterium lactis TaxID=797291 RepID=UPI003DA273DA
MYLEPIQFNKILAQKNLTTSNARGLTISDMNHRWSNGFIPYTIKSGFKDISRIQTAINLINSSTPIKLIQKTNQRDFVEFKSVNGNTSSSALGRVGYRWFSNEGLFTGKQYIEISDGATFGTVIHEIFHAAGLQHEHQRSDAYAHIKINYENIKDDALSQYKTRLGSHIGKFNVKSIMNYGSYVGSSHAKNTNIPVIWKLLHNGIKETYNANRDSITDSDKLALAYLYGPRDSRILKTTSSQSINESYTDQSIDIYDVTKHYKITFHGSSTSNILLPTNNFMRLRIYYDLQQYGAGPGNLITHRTQKDLLVYPGSSIAEFTLNSRYETHQGYYQPSTYMENLVRIEVIYNW